MPQTFDAGTRIMSREQEALVVSKAHIQPIDILSNSLVEDAQRRRWFAHMSILLLRHTAGTWARAALAASTLNI